MKPARRAPEKKRGYAKSKDRTNFDYLKLALIVAIALRLVVFGMAAVAENADGKFEIDGLLHRFTFWDAGHYLRIAEVGYLPTGEDRFFIVFFPLFPLSVWAFKLLVGNVVVAGIASSFVFGVAANFFLLKLVDADYPGLQKRALAFFSLFPTAYFLALPFTESIFCAFSFAAFYYAKKAKWMAAGTAGFLATLSRGTGALIFPALLIEAWEQRDRKKPQKTALAASWLLLIPLATVAYLGLNYAVQGDPFIFSKYQREHWALYAREPWDLISVAARDLAAEPFKIKADNEALVRLVSIAIGGATAVYGAKRMRKSHIAYTVLVTLAHACMNWQISFLRYLLAVFPIHIASAKIDSEHRRIGTVIALTGGALFLVLCWEMVNGRWAF